LLPGGSSAPGLVPASGPGSTAAVTLCAACGARASEISADLRGNRSRISVHALPQIVQFCALI
jgi:hypothetical protein